jgi:hypothetical protein
MASVTAGSDATQKSRRYGGLVGGWNLKGGWFLSMWQECEAAMSESEMRFAHTRDKVLAVVASLLTLAIVVVMRL